MERSNRLSVTQLNNYIKGVFDDELILKNIAVVGEVYECKNSGGNLFFTLKDDDSILRCVRFGGGFVPSIGTTVTVVGSVDYYAKGNRISFRTKNIEPYGEGTLKRKIKELHDKLQAEGLFENRPPLPAFIQKVAIITSETGAVIHDFLSVIKKKNAYIDVVLYPVRVQGGGSETEVANAVTEANTSECDVIVVARGGGSDTDLDVFNTETVARAVANSIKPIISAIGHQVDYTLCDYAASVRAGTPSIAGENVCRINEAFIARFYDCLSRADNAVSGLYIKSRARTCFAAKRLSDDAFSAFFGGKIRLNNLVERMMSVVEDKEELSRLSVLSLLTKISTFAEKDAITRENVLALLAGRLDAVSPLGIISKGYAKIYHDDKVISSVLDVVPGKEINAIVTDGIITANVLSAKKKGE